jgi:hypothetical protein
MLNLAIELRITKKVRLGLLHLSRVPGLVASCRMKLRT